MTPTIKEVIATFDQKFKEVRNPYFTQHMHH
jgi:hypothetical protein